MVFPLKTLFSHDFLIILLLFYMMFSVNWLSKDWYQLKKWMFNFSANIKSMKHVFRNTLCYFSGLILTYKCRLPFQVFVYYCTWNPHGEVKDANTALFHHHTDQPPNISFNLVQRWQSAHMLSRDWNLSHIFVLWWTLMFVLDGDVFHSSAFWGHCVVVG